MRRRRKFRKKGDEDHLVKRKIENCLKIQMKIWKSIRKVGMKRLKQQRIKNILWLY